MGRITHNFIFNYGIWPYEDKQTWVLTSRPLAKLNGANLRGSNSIEDVISEVEHQHLKKLCLLGGGQLASKFLDRQFLPYLSIAELPNDLFSGIPLFSRRSLDNIVHLKGVREKNAFRQIDIRLNQHPQ